MRVSSFATKLARRLACPEDQVDLVRRGSLLRDVGKLGISQELLSQPTLLTVQQYQTIKNHPVMGAALLRECRECQALIPIVLHHHEFFDGHGYPDRIAGNQIELEARIVAVADAVDTMASDRPYRKAFGPRRILSALERCSGTQFDPEVVKAATVLLLEQEAERYPIRQLSFQATSKKQVTRWIHQSV